MIAELIYTIVIFMLAIVFHELAHMFVLAEYIGKFPSLRYKAPFTLAVGYPKQYESLTKEQYIYVHLAGVLFGLIPLVTLNSWFFLVSFTAYVMIGCKSDVVNIARWGK